MQQTEKPECFYRNTGDKDNCHTPDPRQADTGPTFHCHDEDLNETPYQLQSEIKQKDPVYHKPTLHHDYEDLDGPNIKSQAGHPDIRQIPNPSRTIAPGLRQKYLNETERESAAAYHTEDNDSVFYEDLSDPESNPESDPELAAVGSLSKTRSATEDSSHTESTETSIESQVTETHISLTMGSEQSIEVSSEQEQAVGETRTDNSGNSVESQISEQNYSKCTSKGSSEDIHMIDRNSDLDIQAVNRNSESQLEHQEYDRNSDAENDPTGHQALEERPMDVSEQASSSSLEDNNRSQSEDWLVIEDVAPVPAPAPTPTPSPAATPVPENQSDETSVGKTVKSYWSKLKSKAKRGFLSKKKSYEVQEQMAEDPAPFSDVSVQDLRHSYSEPMDNAVETSKHTVVSHSESEQAVIGDNSSSEPVAIALKSPLSNHPQETDTKQAQAIHEETKTIKETCHVKKMVGNEEVIYATVKVRRPNSQSSESSQSLESSGESHVHHEERPSSMHIVGVTTDETSLEASYGRPPAIHIAGVTMDETSLDASQERPKSMAIAGVTTDETADYDTVKEFDTVEQSSEEGIHEDYYGVSDEPITMDLDTKLPPSDGYGYETVDEPEQSVYALEKARPNLENIYESFESSVESVEQKGMVTEGKQTKSRWKRLKFALAGKRKSDGKEKPDKTGLSKASSMFNLSMKVSKDTAEHTNLSKKKSLSATSLSLKAKSKWKFFRKKKNKSTEEEIKNDDEFMESGDFNVSSESIPPQEPLDVDEPNYATIEELKSSEPTPIEQLQVPTLPKNSSSSSLFDTFYEKDQKMYRGKSKSRKSVLSTTSTTLLRTNTCPCLEGEAAEENCKNCEVTEGEVKLKKPKRTYSWLRRTRLSIDEDDKQKTEDSTRSNSEEDNVDDLKDIAEAEMLRKVEMWETSASDHDQELLHDVDLWENESYENLDETKRRRRRISEHLRELNPEKPLHRLSENLASSSQYTLVAGSKNLETENYDSDVPSEGVQISEGDEQSDDDDEFHVSITGSVASSMDEWRPDSTDLHLSGAESDGMDEYEPRLESGQSGTEGSRYSEEPRLESAQSSNEEYLESVQYGVEEYRQCDMEGYKQQLESTQRGMEESEHCPESAQMEEYGEPRLESAQSDEMFYSEEEYEENEKQQFVQSWKFVMNELEIKHGAVDA